MSHLFITASYGLVGLLAGLLINYLADVLPVRRRLSAPFCRLCENDMSWGRFSLPALRCAACGKGRGVRPWLVLLSSAAGFIWIALAPPQRLGVGLGLFWLAYLLLVIVIDVEHHLILHWVTGLGAIAAGLTGIWLHGAWATLLGGAVGFGIMQLFYLLGIAYARWSSRRRGQEIADGDALGFGDVTLSGVIGLLLGWPGVLAGLILAVLLAGVVGILTLLPMIVQRKYNPNLALPYGPFLALGAFYLLYLRP